MTKTELKWRFGKLPTSEEVIKLLEKELITKEEAREILFKEEVHEERDVTSYKEEIKFLRELVDKLSSDRTKVIETIKYLQPSYTGTWIGPYASWGVLTSNGGSGGSYTLTSSASDLSLGSGTTTCAYSIDSTGSLATYTSASGNFSDIETF